MKLEDKLYVLKFKPDEKTHLQPKAEDCANCKEKPCTVFCPAGVYKWEEGKLVVSFENCLECGSCRIGCKFASLEWRYPRGGYGVSFRYG